MSAVIETFLMCDGDGGKCGRTFGVDSRNYNASQHRVDAKINGWRYSGGFDYCPDCKKRKPEVVPPIYKRNTNP